MTPSGIHPAVPVRRRWFRPTPGRLLVVLLAVEGFLWLAERLAWFAPHLHKGYAVLIAVASVAVFLLAMLLWYAFALLFRWRFQFSILSLLELMVAVALSCGWLATEMKAAREQGATVDRIRNVCGNVAYDYQSHLYDIKTKPPMPVWLQRLFGDDLFVNVSFVAVTGPRFDHMGLEHLMGLTQLQALDLEFTRVNDAGLKHLKGLPRLKFLGLCGTNVSDIGLEDLRALRQLQSLDVGYTNVSDAGLQQLTLLSQLRELNLDGTKVTDAGLERLRVLTSLGWLYVRNTEVTDAGAKMLQRALPKCEVCRGRGHRRTYSPTFYARAGCRRSLVAVRAICAFPTP